MTIETVPTGAIEKAGAHVEVHPSGKFVYGTNRQQRSVVIFSIDQTTGRLTLVGHETAGGMITYPEFFALDPSGKYLLLTSSDAVLVFQIDDASGRLTLKTKKASLPSAHAVAVMPAL